MARGRRAKSPEVKALLGNPGKRKLALKNIGKPALPPKRLSVEPPAYLTQDGEREAFRMVLESLPANVARASDVHAFARWATWLNIWVTSKLRLDGMEHHYQSESKHGKFLREHPLSKKMDKAEAHLVTLEDRLCLNIVSRNNIIHRLFQMPGPHPGGMFDEEIPGEKPASEETPPPVPVSPLGWMQHDRTGKPN